MSTYLACFIVSDFKYKTVQIDTKGIGEEFEMRVFATPEQLEKVDFALAVGKSVIEYYVQYFKIPYPLPKLGEYTNNRIIFVGKSISIVLSFRHGCYTRFRFGRHGTLGFGHLS